MIHNEVNVLEKKVDLDVTRAQLCRQNVDERALQGIYLNVPEPL